VVDRDPALALERFSFTYRNQDAPALHEIDMTVAEGEVTGLMGSSGAGKTTLCSAVNGVVPALLRGQASGGVRLFGEEVGSRRVPDWAGTVGVVFQDFESQIFSTQVAMEIAFGPENLGLPPAEIRRRVAECLEGVGLEGMACRNPSTLSGGEKQRLVLASVLALGPRLLVLDEPTTDLDPEARSDLFRLAGALAREGRSLLLVEHEAELLETAGRIGVLSGGRLAREGEASGLRRDPAWMREHGLAPDPVAELWRMLDLQDPPRGAPAAGLELRSMGARLGTPGAGRSGGDAVLEVERLSVRYPGGVEALGDVSLQVREGETLVVVGPNGSGKTTLARTLAGIQRPSSGRVSLGGEGLEGPRGAVGRVGLVFQEPDDQIFSPTVAEEVGFGPRMLGLDEETVGLRTAEAMEAVGLDGRGAEDPFALPKGERQKVAVASVLATEPRVLILDEPTTGLDRRDLDGMLALARRLRDRGHAVVMVTHAMDVAAAEADRVVVLAGGRVVAEGTPRRIFGDPSLLASARLRPPAAVQISASLDGPPALTVAELARRCILPGGRRRPGPDAGGSR
jgi:energy-coupling factor transport system ATP-binding protein